MLAQCFYLVAMITTAITMTASDITLFPNGITLMFGSDNARLTDVQPQSVRIGTTSINSTSTGLTVIFADAVQANMSADMMVNGWLSLPNVSIEANVSGHIHVAKEANNTCITDSFAMSECTMTLSAVARLPLLGNITMENQNVCDYAESVVIDMLTPKPYELYPAALEGTTSLAKSTYLMKLKLVNLFADSTGMPVEADFVAPNVVRLAIGAPLGSGINFNSEHESDVEIFDAIDVLTRFAKKKLNINIDPVKSNSTVIPYGTSGEIRVPTLRSIIHGAIAEGAIAALHTSVPRASGIVYDLIVNDFRCRAFNTICSLPVEGGVTVVNARFTGIGDLGTILDNTAGARIDALLTQVATAAFKIAGSTFGDRIYLPIF